MVKKLLFEHTERCVNSYLIGMRAKTAADLVNVALYMDSVKINPYIEFGQLFFTKSWRIRQDCLTAQEQGFLAEAMYVQRINLSDIPETRVTHNLGRRMGLAMRLAFQCLYDREKKNLASAEQT